MPTWLRTTTIVARRELHEHALSATVWTLAGSAVILAVLSASVGVQMRRVHGLAHAELVAQRTRDQLKSGGQATGGQVESGLRVVRPPEPLSIVVTASDAGPRYWDFGPTGRRPGWGAPDDARTVLPAGIADVRYVVTVILGLLSISLSWTAVAGERANGSLLALLGQAVRPLSVVAGKFAAGTITLGTAIVLVDLAVVGVILTREPEWLTRDAVVTLGFLSAAGLLYLLTNFAAGVLIGSASSSYRSTLLLTVFIWVVTTSVVSPAADLLARALTPRPAAPLIVARLEEKAQLSLLDAQIEMGDAWVQSSPRPREGGLSLDNRPDPAALAAIEIVWNRRMALLRTELQAIEAGPAAAAARQSRVLRAMNLLSPAAEYLRASAQLAGVGDRMEGRWQESTRRYQTDLERALFDDRPRLTLQTPTQSLGIRAAGRALVAIQRHPFPRFEALPPFRPPDDRFKSRLRDAAPALGVLLTYVILLSTLAAGAFCRIRF